MVLNSMPRCRERLHVGWVGITIILGMPSDPHYPLPPPMLTAAMLLLETYLFIPSRGHPVLKTASSRRSADKSARAKRAVELVLFKNYWYYWHTSARADLPPTRLWLACQSPVCRYFFVLLEHPSGLAESHIYRVLSC